MTKLKPENCIIRHATMEDLEAITEVERSCFPAAEAADREAIRKRLERYPHHFMLRFDGELLVSFVNGLVTDREDLTDEMYSRGDMHQEDGAWQMIFGVDTVPEYRRKGLAGHLLKLFIEEARQQNRKGLVLTCKEHMLSYYEKFGFKNEGLSESVHGDAVWYQMRLRF